MAKELISKKVVSGGRKTSVARIRVNKGSGKIFINGKREIDYLRRKVLVNYIFKPLEVVEKRDDFDIIVKCNGGGLSGQAGAIRYAISKFLNEYFPDTRQSLKEFGFLTRDPRKIERKKYGRKKARKSFQFSKR